MSDDDRDLLLADHDLVCQQCGNLRSECSDPMRDWHPNATVCYATATAQWGQRVLVKKYPEPADEGSLHDLDGLTVWASAVDLSDPEFLPAGRDLGEADDDRQPARDSHE